MKKLKDYQFRYELEEIKDSVHVISLLSLTKIKTIPKTNIEDAISVAAVLTAATKSVLNKGTEIEVDYGN